MLSDPEKSVAESYMRIGRIDGFANEHFFTCLTSTISKVGSGSITPSHSMAGYARNLAT